MKILLRYRQHYQIFVLFALRGLMIYFLIRRSKAEDSYCKSNFEGMLSGFLV